MKWRFGVGIAAALTAGSVDAATEQMREGAYRVAIVGDSLATGAGIGVEQGYPGLMQQLAVNERWPVRITVHAGNGETTADGVRRMNEVLATRPDVVVLALGGNDGLQGRPPEEIRTNLEEMIRRVLTTGAQFVLTGMEAPPTASMDYRIRFRAAFSRLGRTRSVGPTRTRTAGSVVVGGGLSATRTGRNMRARGTRGIVKARNRRNRDGWRRRVRLFLASVRTPLGGRLQIPHKKKI